MWEWPLKTVFTVAFQNYASLRNNNVRSHISLHKYSIVSLYRGNKGCLLQISQISMGKLKRHLNRAIELVWEFW